MRTQPCAAALILLSLGVPGGAQDGRAILDRMASSYAALQSYTHVLSASRVQHVAGATGSSGSRTIVRFARPNRLYLLTTAPNQPGGTFVSVCDGRQQVSYATKFNCRLTAPAPTGLPGLLRNLTSYGVGQVADLPVQLLGGRQVLSLIQSPVRGKDASVNGVPCYTVTGQYSNPGIARQPGRLTLWIARADFLLRKASAVYTGIPVSYRVRNRQTGKTATEKRHSTMDVQLTAYVQDPVRNPRLEASAFTYPIPKDARDIRPPSPRGRAR